MVGVGEEEGVGNATDQGTGELAALVGDEQIHVIHAEQSEHTYNSDR